MRAREITAMCDSQHLSGIPSISACLRTALQAPLRVGLPIKKVIIIHRSERVTHGTQGGKAQAGICV